MIRDTSLMAYNDYLPKMSAARLQVLKALEELGEACNQELSGHLKWEINRVTPRVNELLKMNILEGEKKRYWKTGKTVYYWKIKNKN